MLLDIATTKEARSMAVALFPKNGGLKGQIGRIRERFPMPDDMLSYAVRGEDVPFLANELAKMGRRVLAFTGDDLLDEWLAEGNVIDAGLARRKIAWSDPAAIYGAPALCLIGESPAILREGRALRIVLCTRYRRITEQFLTALCSDGLRLDALAIQGTLETCLVSGVADLIVDIVVSGRTVQQAGLQVLRVIRTSDIAVLESSRC